MVNANQQLDLSSNPLVFDTIQIDGLKPNATRDLTLFSIKPPVDVTYEVDVKSKKKLNKLPKVQPSAATRTTVDTKQHDTNIQIQNRELKILQDIVKTNLSLSYLNNRKHPLMMRTCRRINSLMKSVGRTKLTICFLYLAVFIIASAIIFSSAIQQVKRPDEQTQKPFLAIPAQETHQLLFKNRESHIGFESSTAQNQSEVQILSNSRDTINKKQCQQLLEQKQRFRNCRLTVQNLTSMYKDSKSKCAKFKHRLCSKSK